MTNGEAINILKTESCCECPKAAAGYRGCGDCNIVKATWHIRKALEEIRQYRKIGTVEECRAAAGKIESIVDQLEESVKLARQRCIDCPVNSPAYAIYQIQYHERAMFLEIVKDIVEREM